MEPRPALLALSLLFLPSLLPSLPRVAGVAQATEPPAPDPGASDTAAKDDPAKEAKDVARMDLRALWAQAQARAPALEAARHNLAGAMATRDEQSYMRLPSGELAAYLTGSPKIECKDTVLDVTGPDGLPTANKLTLPDRYCLSTNTNLTLTEANIGKVLPINGVAFRLDLRIVQPLYTFGKLLAARDLGRVGVDMARASADATRADLGLNLARAYYGLKSLRAALITVREGNDQIQVWIKRIDKDLEKGKGGYTEFDLARLKVASSSIELALVDLERTHKSTVAALRYLVQDSRADIDEEELAPVDLEERPLSYYLDQALQHRPELKTLEATGRGAVLYRKLRFAELLPDLGLVGSLNYSAATGINDANITNAFLNRYNYLGASLLLALRQPLDLGPRIARLRKAEADVRQFDAKRRELLGGGALEIERAYNDVQEARGRLKVAETAERRARGWLQGVKQAMDVGTAESRDMTEALRAYFDQHLLVIRTINDLNVQCAALRRTAGMEVIPARD